MCLCTKSHLTSCSKTVCRNQDVICSKDSWCFLIFQSTLWNVAFDSCFLLSRKLDIFFSSFCSQVSARWQRKYNLMDFIWGPCISRMCLFFSYLSFWTDHLKLERDMHNFNILHIFHFWYHQCLLLTFNNTGVNHVMFIEHFWVTMSNSFLFCTCYNSA